MHIVLSLTTAIAMEGFVFASVIVAEALFWQPSDFRVANTVYVLNGKTRAPPCKPDPGVVLPMSGDVFPGFIFPAITALPSYHW